MRVLGAVCTFLLVWLLVLCGRAEAFYLPGTAPHDYHERDELEVQVNVLTSVSTHLPYDYYSLPFCFPKKKTHGQAENLGEILMGDRIKPSPYESLRIGDDSSCDVVCSLRVDSLHSERIMKRIRQDYMVNLLADNLPLAVVHEDTGTYSVGVPLGTMIDDVPYVYNHLHFTVKYYVLSDEEAQTHRDAQQRNLGTFATSTAPPATDEEEEHQPIYRIISFVAKPYSVKHTLINGSRTCPDESMKHDRPTQRASDATVTWSYGVSWQSTTERWTTRWDVYLNVADHDVHWLSIVNSVLIVILLTAMVALIFIRALRRDINMYNRMDIDPEDLHEETGWKLIHKDVFRPPVQPLWLAALAGTGIQLLGMALSVLVFAVLGFLSPANRGSLFTALIVCFVFLGMYAGYTSARLLKLWGTTSWMAIFATATAVPGVAFGTFFVVNLAVWTQGSAGAAPFHTMISVIALWFWVSLPLVFLGAVLGYKRDKVRLPIQSCSLVPKHIPEQKWHVRPWFTVLVAGMLPFGAVFIEAFFILTAVWLNRYYYVFGFLFLVFIIVLVTCAEVTIVMTYFQLCAEDWRWWWRSFLTSGSCGLYLYAYSLVYFFTSTMRMTSFVPILIYFSYMGLLSFIFSVMTGTVGFFATFFFVRYIYGSIKVD